MGQRTNIADALAMPDPEDHVEFEVTRSRELARSAKLD